MAGEGVYLLLHAIDVESWLFIQWVSGTLQPCAINPLLVEAKNRDVADRPGINIYAGLLKISRWHYTRKVQPSRERGRGVRGKRRGTKNIPEAKRPTLTSVGQTAQVVKLGMQAWKVSSLGMFCACSHTGSGDYGRWRPKG